MSSVLIADDHLLFTDLVGAFLIERGVDVVGVATTEIQALDRTRERRPDVCLADAVALASGSVTAFVAQLSRAAPHTAVIVLTGAADDPGPRAAAAAGAAGHLRKSVSGDDLLEAIDRAARGEIGVGTELDPTAEGLTAVPGGREDGRNAHQRLAGLRAREHECLSLIVDGASTEEMAATMGITVATVRSHVRAVLAALGVHSRLGAASFALRHGLGDPASRSRAS